MGSDLADTDMARRQTDCEVRDLTSSNRRGSHASLTIHCLGRSCKASLVEVCSRRTHAESASQITAGRVRAGSRAHWGAPIGGPVSATINAHPRSPERAANEGANARSCPRPRRTARSHRSRFGSDLRKAPAASALAVG